MSVQNCKRHFKTLVLLHSMPSLSVPEIRAFLRGLRERDLLAPEVARSRTARGELAAAAMSGCQPLAPGRSELQRARQWNRGESRRAVPAEFGQN
jgi:hypothetical protein